MNSFRAPYAGFPVMYPEVYPEMLPDLYPDNDDEERTATQKPAKVWIYRRNFIGVLAFFGCFFAYMIRTNLSVAIVHMTDPDPTKPNSTAAFDWNTKERGSLLGAFFIGYVFTQIIGGWFSIKVGGAKVFGAGILVSSLLALAIPSIVPFGIVAFFITRAAQGFVQGATYPSMHAVWSRWAPPDERSRLASLGFSGAFMGTTITYPLCSVIGKYLGWPYMFYIPGAMSCLWWIVWFTFVRDSPEHDPWISIEELDYLRATLGDMENKDIKHPWLKFFTSFPVWAIVVSHFCQNWGFYTMFANIPSFLRETLQFDLITAGVLSCLPFLWLSIGLPIAGMINDKIRRSGMFSITTIRKFFNCGAFMLQCGIMFLVTRFENRQAIVACLTLVNGIGAFAWAAFGVNHLDIAPPHAGVLMGISNMVATFSGVISTQLTGHIIIHETLEEWSQIFLICSVFYFSGAFFYLFFGSGEKQKWVKDTSTVTTKTAATTTVEDEDDFYESAIEFGIPGIVT